eukprot:3290148-Prymnesium_polylepis.1
MNLTSRQKVSLFRPSGAATHPWMYPPGCGLIHNPEIDPLSAPGEALDCRFTIDPGTVVPGEIHPVDQSSCGRADPGHPNYDRGLIHPGVAQSRR